MKTINVTVGTFVTTSIEVDETRLNDEDYLDSIREKAYEAGSDALEDPGSISWNVTNADIDELVE